MRRTCWRKKCNPTRRRLREAPWFSTFYLPCLNSCVRIRSRSNGSSNAFATIRQHFFEFKTADTFARATMLTWYLWNHRLPGRSRAKTRFINAAGRLLKERAFKSRVDKTLVNGRVVYDRGHFEKSPMGMRLMHYAD